MRTIVINSSNYLQNSGNRFIYNFPQTAAFSTGTGIGVAGIAVYNSFQNINIARNNNTLVLNWLGTNYTFTIPPGYYSISDLNYFLQQQCVINGLYMTANNGSNNVYFAEIVINGVRYATSLNIYAIPTAAQATALGYSQPAYVTWAFPATAQTPTLTFGQQFGNLVGLTFGTYPPVAQATNIQYLSTTTPVISPINSLILCCNLVSSKYSIPNNVFYTIPISSSIGSLIQVNPSSVVYNGVIHQNFSTLEITIYDQQFNAVQMIDTEFTLTLALTEPGDV